MFSKIAKSLIPSFIALFLLVNGCIGPKKYARYVDSACGKYKTRPVQKDAISIRLAHSAAFDSTVDVKKGSGYFIPALFYWGVRESFLCELNPSIPENIFAKAFIKYADSPTIAQKLNGRQLEIIIDTLPTHFQYSYDSHTIFLLVAYGTSALQKISPQHSQLGISYKLYNNGAIEKEGKMAFTCSDAPFVNNWKSTKKVTQAYMHEYANDIRYIAGLCMDKLAREL